MSGCRNSARAAVQAYILAGRKGTVRDIAAAVGRSRNDVQYALRVLLAEGAADVVAQVLEASVRGHGACQRRLVNVWGLPPPAPTVAELVRAAHRQRTPLEFAWQAMVHGATAGQAAA